MQGWERNPAHQLLAANKLAFRRPFVLENAILALVSFANQNVFMGPSAFPLKVKVYFCFSSVFTRSRHCSVVRFLLSTVVCYGSPHIQWDIRNYLVVIKHLEHPLISQADAVKYKFIFIPTNFTCCCCSLCFLSGVVFGVPSRGYSWKGGVKLLCPAQICVQNAERDVKYQKWSRGWGGARPSALHPSVAWPSASGLHHLWYAHPCTSASFWSVDQSFSDFCQALILWKH